MRVLVCCYGGAAPSNRIKFSESRSVWDLSGINNEFFGLGIWVIRMKKTGCEHSYTLDVKL